MEYTRKRAKQESPTFYLTLVSVISSLAFGYLLNSLELRRLVGGEWEFLYWAKVLALLQMIFLVWHEYVMGTVLFTWVIGYADSAILFLYGLVIFAGIKTKTARFDFWLSTVAAYALISCAAYYNQWRKASSEPENARVLQVLRIPLNQTRSLEFHKWTIPYCVCTCFLTFAYILLATIPALTHLRTTSLVCQSLAVVVNLNFASFTLLTSLTRRRVLKPGNVRARRAGA